MSLWKRGRQIIADSDGKLILCDTCPCAPIEVDIRWRTVNRHAYVSTPGITDVDIYDPEYSSSSGYILYAALSMAYTGSFIGNDYHARYGELSEDPFPWWVCSEWETPNAEYEEVLPAAVAAANSTISRAAWWSGLAPSSSWSWRYGHISSAASSTFSGAYTVEGAWPTEPNSATQNGLAVAVEGQTRCKNGILQELDKVRIKITVSNISFSRSSCSESSGSSISGEAEITPARAGQDLSSTCVILPDIVWPGAFGPLPQLSIVECGGGWHVAKFPDCYSWGQVATADVSIQLLSLQWKDVEPPSSCSVIS